MYVFFKGNHRAETILQWWFFIQTNFVGIIIFTLVWVTEACHLHFNCKRFFSHFEVYKKGNIWTYDLGKVMRHEKMQVYTNQNID